MSEPRRRPPRRRPTQTRAPRPVDLWRPVPRLPDPEPVVAADDPTAALRSLGDPPLPGDRVAAGHYLASVIERAATLAVGLASAANLPTEVGGVSTDASGTGTLDLPARSERSVDRSGRERGFEGAS